MTDTTAPTGAIEAKTDRISGGAGDSTPKCPSCPFVKPDQKHPGWGWCDHPRNRVYDGGWPNGFTPSQSPSGSCELHPERAAAAIGRSL